ncbi:unnamed protein product [Clonostachys chloroleuca]|uniref:Uncharacterized protein n=1 Tax=Clonostachys chloroleuca TaxID=1926264 RepID=A0AA35MBY2_9HYPO|nr:unnamed protein product [Clonostachys chloroleuca]
MQLSMVLFYAIAAVGVTAQFERDIDLERRAAALDRAYLRARAALYEDANRAAKAPAKGPARARVKAQTSPLKKGLKVGGQNLIRKKRMTDSV